MKARLKRRQPRCQPPVSEIQDDNYRVVVIVHIHLADLIRKSTIGTITPRRFVTPLKTLACSQSVLPDRSHGSPALQDINTVLFITKGKYQKFLACGSLASFVTFVIPVILLPFYYSGGGVRHTLFAVYRLQGGDSTISATLPSPRMVAAEMPGTCDSYFQGF